MGAVDHEVEIVVSYITKNRDRKAAIQFFKRTLERHGRVEALVADGVQSYPEAMQK